MRYFVQLGLKITWLSRPWSLPVMALYSPRELQDNTPALYFHSRANTCPGYGCSSNEACFPCNALLPGFGLAAFSSICRSFAVSPACSGCF